MSNDFQIPLNLHHSFSTFLSLYFSLVVNLVISLLFTLFLRYRLEFRYLKNYFYFQNNINIQIKLNVLNHGPPIFTCEIKNHPHPFPRVGEG